MIFISIGFPEIEVACLLRMCLGALLSNANSSTVIALNAEASCVGVVVLILLAFGIAPLLVQGCHL